jgi:DNA-binding NarL/FixJ family response regulator
MITVLIADDHAMVREGLRALLSSMEGYQLVGTASTGADAIREAVLLKPDLLVLDIGFPDLNGIEVVRRLTRAAPTIKILMLTMYDDDESILGAVRAGALGYVLKGADPDDLLRAITAVAAGEAIFGPGLARRALQALSAPREAAFAELTRREREVLELIASGMSNAAIAGKLGLSTNTISNHISSIFSKLQVESRAEAIVRARSAGLGD